VDAGVLGELGREGFGLAFGGIGREQERDGVGFIGVLGSGRRTLRASWRSGALATPATRGSRPVLFVHLSSERTLEPVRQDSSFAEKHESHTALLLVVLPLG
jgi:hypothetical protein